MVELRKVTDENFTEVIRLEVGEGQDKFVAPNLYTLAEAYVALTTDEFVPMPYAIYEADTLVGFIALAYQPAGTNGDASDGSRQGHYDMYRFMIDKRFQGRGLGRAALERAIALVKTLPHGPGSHVRTSFVPENEAARGLYGSLGFKETGEVDGEELVAELPLP